MARHESCARSRARSTYSEFLAEALNLGFVLRFALLRPSFSPNYRDTRDHRILPLIFPRRRYEPIARSWMYSWKNGRVIDTLSATCTNIWHTVNLVCATNEVFSFCLNFFFYFCIFLTLNERAHFLATDF